MTDSNRLVGVTLDDKTVTKGDALLVHPNIPPQPPTSSKPTPSKPSASPNPPKNGK